MLTRIDVWEDDGGAGAVPERSTFWISGSDVQIEWAERIRRNIRAEFDRVAATFRAVARKQSDQKRTETESVLEILEDLRRKVLSNRTAGYYIRDWQEIGDQVRQMIFADSRYQALKAKREARQ